MASPEGTHHSFVVRVWREPREGGEGAGIWRGMIEHVASGRRRYFEGPRAISGFVLPFTGGAGPPGAETDPSPGDPVDH